MSPESSREVAEQVRAMKLSAAYDFTADMGSLISEDQIKTISNHVDDAKAKAPRMVAGGKARPDIPGRCSTSRRC